MSTAHKKIFRGFFIFLFFISLFPSSGQALDFRRDPKISEVRPPKPVKVHLKRDASGNYSWDITGTDVNAIVRQDRILRKYMKGLEKERK